MNFKVVIKVISLLLILTGLLMLSGIPFSVYYGDDDIIALIIAAIITSFTGLLAWISTRKSDDRELGKRVLRYACTNSSLNISCNCLTSSSVNKYSLRRLLGLSCNGHLPFMLFNVYITCK